MITDATMLYLFVETPLHAGVGSGLSSIDLPIQRERTTQYPMIQGSGIKGKLRATAEDAVGKNGITKDDVEILFGPVTNRPGERCNAGLERLRWCAHSRRCAYPAFPCALTERCLRLYNIVRCAEPLCA